MLYSVEQHRREQDLDRQQPDYHVAGKTTPKMPYSAALYHDKPHDLIPSADVTWFDHMKVRAAGDARKASVNSS